MFFWPGAGFISDGRKLYTALKGSRASAFSALPFTRAHITFPCSLPSVCAPETWTRTMPGLRRASVCAK